MFWFFCIICIPKTSKKIKMAPRITIWLVNLLRKSYYWKKSVGVLLWCYLAFFNIVYFNQRVVCLFFFRQKILSSSLPLFEENPFFFFFTKRKKKNFFFRHFFSIFFRKKFEKNFDFWKIPGKITIFYFSVKWKKKKKKKKQAISPPFSHSHPDFPKGHLLSKKKKKTATLCFNKPKRTQFIVKKKFQLELWKSDFQSKS